MALESLLKIYADLDSQGYCLKPFSREDEDQLYAIFKTVVDSGAQFPYECNSLQEFHKQFLNPQSHVYVCHSHENKVIGGFFVRANFSGRSQHIANGAYMLHEAYRGQGIGTLLAKASLQIAKEFGFKAMQFNMVFSQNHAAIKVYRNLGFEIIGTIPKAICNPDGSYQDGFVMHRELED